MVIAKDEVLQRALFDLFHAGVIGDHSRVQATRHRLVSIVYWKGLTKDV